MRSAPGLSRRAFLVGAGAVVLVACGDDDTSGTTAPALSLDEAEPGDVRIQAAFGGPVFPAGRELRAPFVAFDMDGVLRSGAPDQLDLEVRLDDELLESQTVVRHDEGTATPFFPLRFAPPSAGVYDVRIAGTDAGASMLVNESGEVTLPQVGETLVPVDTPTFDDPRGIEQLCTRLPEPCPYHEITLTEAIDSGSPVAFLISTPGFCQTDSCGPVLDMLIDATADRDDIVAIHAEVYQNPSAFADGNPELTEAVVAYELTFEPSLLVADATGTITARLDFLWDAGETREALATV